MRARVLGVGRHERGWTTPYWHDMGELSVRVAIVRRGKVCVVLISSTAAVVNGALVVGAGEGDRAMVQVVSSCTSHRIPLGFYA
jgi:hypothetical protein